MTSHKVRWILLTAFVLSQTALYGCAAVAGGAVGAAVGHEIHKHRKHHDDD
jgi:hypothetical protein